MAIAFGASTTSGVISSVSSNTFSSPSISGSDTILIVCVANRDGASDTDGEVTSITHNGLSLTKAHSSSYPNAAYLEAQIWYRVAPSTGVNNITVNYTGTIDTGAVWAAYFTGVDQTTVGDKIGAANNDAASATDPAVTLTTTHNGSLIMSVVYNKTGSNLTIGGGQTSLTQQNVNAGGDRADAGYVIQGTAGSITPTWVASPDDDWVQVSVEFLAAATGSTSLIKSVSTVAKASIKSISTVPIASIKKINGVTNT